MTRKKASVLLASIIMIVVLLMPLVGCMGSEPPADSGGTGPIPTLPQLQGQLNDISSQVSSLSSRVGSLEARPDPGTVDLGPINIQLSEIQATLNSISARVTELESEENPSSNNSSGIGETTRWNFRGAEFADIREEWKAGKVLSNSDFNFVFDYDRIDDAGLYDVELMIEYDPVDTEASPAAVTLTDAEIELRFVPRDYIAVSEDTYLDSDDEPWLYWDAEFVTREREGVETCRQIIFTSDREGLGTLDQGDYIILELVLELYYAS